MSSDELDTGILRRVRQKLSPFEKHDRWYDYPRRLRIIMETDGEYNMESRIEARAYQLKDDELRVEKNLQTMNGRKWTSYERDRIVSAEVLAGETIIPERDSDE